MIDVESMRRSCVIFNKLNGDFFDIDRPEVESRWSVFVEIIPTKKQIKELDGLGWYYDEEAQTFSQYF